MNRFLLSSASVILGLFPVFVHAQRPVLNEIVYDPVGVNTGRQTIELYNPTDTSIDFDVEPLWVRVPPVAWRLPPTALIPPRGILVIHFNAFGTDSDTEVYTGASGLRNLRGEDSVALYSSNLFQDASAMVDFVQWGAGGLGGEDVAAAAGIWTADAFVDVASLRAGSGIAYDGSGDAATDWCVDGTPSVGAPNDVCTPSFARQPVLLNEAGFTGSLGSKHAFVELKNFGDVLEDLSDHSIALGGAGAYRMPPNTLLGAGEILVVRFGVQGEDSATDLFAENDLGLDFEASNSLSWHASEQYSDPTYIVDFLQWGASGQPLEDVAATAGIWERGEVVESLQVRSRGAIAVLAGELGERLWGIDNTPTAGHENSAPPQEPPVVINEVLLDPPGEDPGQQVVELTNRDPDAAVDIAGYTLCVQSLDSPGTTLCYTVPEGYVLQAASFLLVRLDRDGVDREGEVFTGEFRQLRRDRDELALYCTPVSTDRNNLVDYMRWGQGSLLLEEVAVDVGIWPAGNSVRVSQLRDGSSIAYLGEGDAASSYRIDLSPSPGEDNEEPDAMLPFRRGDCNDDGGVDISDAVAAFGYLFRGQRAPFCLAACDGNGDETIDISDPVFVLNHLFQGGVEPPAPGPEHCGTHDGAVTCNSYLSCPGP